MKYYPKLSGASECICHLANTQVLNYQESKSMFKTDPSRLKDEQDQELLPFSYTGIKVTWIQRFFNTSTWPNKAD